MTTASAQRPEITERQLECVRYLALGWTDEAIGERLGISARTVKSHFVALRYKLNVKTKRELPIVLHEMGFSVYPQ